MKVRNDLMITLENLGTYLVDKYEQVPAEFQTIRSDSAVKPNMKWNFVDRKGHLHKWSEDGKRVVTGGTEFRTAIKRRETVHCDGTCGFSDCEGWTRVAWNCRLCGALISPSYEPDYSARMGIPIMTLPGYMVLTVRSDGAMYDEVKRLGSVSGVVHKGNSRINGTVYPYDDDTIIYGRAGDVWNYFKLRFDYANKV